MSSTCDDGSEQSSRAGNAGRSLAKTAARKGTKSGAKWVFAILGVKGIAIVGAILLVLLLIAAAMTAGQIQAFIDGQGCTPAGCLGRATYSWPAVSVAWCQPVAAGSGSFAVMLSTVSTACGINPQVGLVMIAKESQGLTRNPPP